MSSRFRTEIRKYWIFCILDNIMETVFVGKSYAQNPKAHYYSHLRGEHSLTEDAYVDADLTEPKYIILEVLNCTGRVAFKHVLAWYHFFEEQGYAILTEEKVGYMVDNMSLDTQKIYEEVCAPYTLEDVLTREVQEPSGHNLKSDEREEKKDKDALVQFNVRVKESVAQSYRSFCKERGVTQSEGLRLLLMGEDYEKRDSLMQSYQKEIDMKDAEIAELKAKNKELLALQKDKESWVFRKRKEWIDVAKTMLSYAIGKTEHREYIDWNDSRVLSIKSREGHELFSSHQYPIVGGGYEVELEGFVWGIQNKKTNPDYSAPIFVFGMLMDKTLVKFRWYYQKSIIGASPLVDEFSSKGSKWIMGCVISKDGAADLVSAVPLAGLKQIDYSDLDVGDLFQIPQPEGKTSNLDRMIAKAATKRLISEK